MFNEKDLDIGSRVNLEITSDGGYLVADKDDNSASISLIKNSNEKDFNEAIKAFKNKEFVIALSWFDKVISEKYKIAESINYLIELKQYKKSAEYLIDNEYLMSEQDINSLKQKIKDKIDSSYFKNIYYDKAKSAQENGEIDKAIIYYEKYIIENGQNLISENLIINLMKLYIKSKKIDDGLNLLDSNSIKKYKINSDITVTTKNKLYIQLYIGKIDNAIKNGKEDNDSLAKLKSIYEQLFWGSNGIDYVQDEKAGNDKVDYSVKLANIFYKISQYNTSKDYSFRAYKYFKSMKEKDIDLSEEIKQKLVNLLDKLMVYFYTYAYSKSKELAEQLLYIDKNNIKAYNVQNKTFSNPKESFDSNINEFIKRKIYNTELKNIQYKDVISSEDNLKNLIDNAIYKYKEYNNDSEFDEYKFLYTFEIYKKLSDRNFQVAKIIRDKGDFEDIFFFKEHYYLLIAEACCHYAHSRLYNINNEKKFDEARYGYLQTIILHKKNKDIIIDKTSLCIAVELYIKSFFIKKEELEKENILSLYKIRNNKNNKDKNLIKNTISKSMKYIKDNNQYYSDELLLKFTIGIIELLENSDINENDILCHIFFSPYLSRIIDCLSEILDEKIENENIKRLRDLRHWWKKATNKYNGFAFEDGEVCGLIKKCLENLFERGEFKKSFDNLENYLKNSDSNNYSKILAKIKDSNYTYMSDFYNILKSVLIYNEKDRASKIKKLAKDINIPLNKIFSSLENFPTFFYNETPWGGLRAIFEDKIKEQARKLEYTGFKLKIETEYAIHFKKNIIDVNLILKNISPHDLDNIEIKSLASISKYLKELDIPTESYSLESNSKKPVNFKLKFQVIDEKIWEDLEFSFNIEINYTYRDILDDTKKCDKPRVFPLVIRLNDIKNFKEIENPFSIYEGGNPISPEDRSKMFYGRKKDLEEIISKITDKNGNIRYGVSLAIYGQKRTGKSSIFNYLEKELRQRDKDNIIVNCGSCGDIDPSIESFLYNILDVLNLEIKTNHKKLSQLLKDKNIVIDIDKILNNPSQAFVIFNSQFRNICNIVHSKNKQIIVMIDEFTYIYKWIKEGLMTEQIMKFWKAFLQNNGIFAIIVGQDNMMNFVNDPRFTNDFGTTEKKQVTYLDEKSAKELMFKPILNCEEKSRYTNEALDYLYELTSGSAFLIMKLCAGLVRYINLIKSHIIRKFDIEEYLKYSIPKPEFNEADYFDSQYNDVNQSNDLNEKNKEIISNIVKFSDDEEDGLSKISDIVKSEQDKELLQCLISRDVVIKQGEYCKLKIGLYKKWIEIKEGIKKDGDI